MGSDFVIGLEDHKPLFFLNSADWGDSLKILSEFREQQVNFFSDKVASKISVLKIDLALFLSDISTILNAAAAMHIMIVQTEKEKYERISQAVAHRLVDLYADVVAQDALLKDVYRALAGQKSHDSLVPRLDSLVFGCRKIIDTFTAAMLEQFKMSGFAPLIDYLKELVSRPEYASLSTETEVFLARGQY